MGRNVGLFLFLVFGVTFLPEVVFAQSNTEAREVELEQAKLAWQGCVQVNRARRSGPPVSDPRNEVNASRVPCAQHWKRAKAAIQDVELAAGRPATGPHADDLFNDIERKVAASLLEAGPDLFRNSISPGKANDERPTPPQPMAMACKGSVQKGLRAYQQGDYEGALCHWLPKARVGDAVAQNNMGVLFEGGLTSQTPRSDEQAAEWFILSARQGFVQAMHNLANVQTRLGYREAANSWLAMANSVQQQQNQAASALGYALGCAIAGGCLPPTAPMILPPTSATQQPPKPPKCQLSPFLKDFNGNPKVECK
ncbi:MAG: sel1 repeat family protein [Sphingomonadales bacterium]|nr:sel1 repeat family protein [Sphingomonadales bacterium]MBK6490445.1 sel1 repeat family protein [Sphingomonadales bacterium]MBK6719597.1 sel1 repeat family protein [Sphingomonadales bacterium]MBK9999770.1 sel1 repeat family protein [Sphingomonadales bacterium]